MKNLKIFISTFLIFTIFAQPQILMAQVDSSGTGGAVAPLPRISPSATPPSLAPRTTPNTSNYNPVASSDTKKTFSGTSFNSVGGAIAGCANVQGLISDGVNKLFKKQIDKLNTLTGKDIPVKDSAATAELKRANRTKECLDGIAFAVQKKLLEQISNKTLNWINKGLDGNPFYVQDVNSNLKSIRDEKLNQYLDRAQNSNPIFGNAIRSTLTQQTTGLSDGYLNKVMNTPEAVKYQNFQNNFSQGGWGALLNMKYNPIGAVFNSSDNLQKNIDLEQEARFNEIQRNNGFLDMRECVEYEKITEPTLPANSPLARSSVPRVPICIRWKTTTPGSIISQQAYNVLGSPTRQLELADSINEILGAYFDQQLNSLFQRGLASLKNKNSGTYGANGGFGQNVVLGSNGVPISTTGNLNSGYQISNSGYDVQDFDISRPQQIYDITKAQYDFRNRAKDSQIAMNSIVPTLGALDYCIPGPNPTWADSLGDNYQSFIGSLDTPTKGRSTLGNILNSIPIIGSLFGGDDKEIPYILAGQPTLFDKVLGDSITISPWSYMYYTKDYDRGVKNTDGNWIRGYINSGYQRLVTKYQNNFSEGSIINLFTSFDPNTAFATGTIKSALKETANIVSYSQNLSPLDDAYEQAISDTEDDLAELEGIRREVLGIVKVAKARYIRERADAGNPVDMTCLNKAYVINENPIVGASRQESDIPNPMIQESKDASDYFYSKL